MEILHNTHLVSNSSASNHSFGNDWEEKANRFDETTFNTLLRSLKPKTMANEIITKKRRFKLNCDTEQSKQFITIKKIAFRTKDSVDSLKNQPFSKCYGISDLTEVEILNGKMRVIELKREGKNVFFINPNLNIEYKGNKNILEDTYHREIEFAYQGKTTFKVSHMNGGVNNNEFYYENPKVMSVEELYMKENNNNNQSYNKDNKTLNLLRLSNSDNERIIKEAKAMFDNSSQNYSNLVPNFQSFMLPSANNNHFAILCKNKSSSFMNNDNMSQRMLYKSDDRFNSDKIKLKKIKHRKINNNLFVTKEDNFIIECNLNSFDRFSVIQKQNENEVHSDNSSISLTPRNEKIIKECKSIQVSLEGSNNEREQGKYRKKDALGDSIHPSEESSFSSNHNEKEQEEETEKEENIEEQEENNEIVNKESSNSNDYKKPPVKSIPYYLRNINNERRESEISSKFKNIRLDNIDKVKHFKEHQLKNKQFLNNSNNSSFNDSINDNDKNTKERRKSNLKIPSQSQSNKDSKHNKQNKNETQFYHRCKHGKSYQKHSGQPDICPICVDRLKKNSENFNSKYNNNNSNLVPIKGNTTNGSSFYDTYEKNIDYYRTMIGGNTKTKEGTPTQSSRTIKFKSKLSGGDKVSKGKMESIMKPQQINSKSPNAVTFKFENGSLQGTMISNNRRRNRKNSQNSNNNNLNVVQLPSVKSK